LRVTKQPATRNHGIAYRASSRCAIASTLAGSSSCNHTLFLPTSIFSDHPELSLDLRDTPRDAVKASFFVRITLFNLGQRKHALNMFQNFAPLVFNHVANHRGEIILR
jgi:hypothetical protein